MIKDLRKQNHIRNEKSGKDSASNVTSNYAFIDSQNLNLGVRDEGWKLDFARFRVYLNEKYNVTKAYLFIGYLEHNQQLYAALQNYGFTLIFKHVLEYQPGKVKGNVDAELVLQTMIELKNFDRAVVVSGDGDFHCLVRYLIKKNKLKKVLVPNKTKYSALLKKIPSEYLAFISDLQKQLEYQIRKEPRKDKTLKGAFRRDVRSISKKEKESSNRNKKKDPDEDKTSAG